jgi:hypothetical protein
MEYAEYIQKNYSEAGKALQLAYEDLLQNEKEQARIVRSEEYDALKLTNDLKREAYFLEVLPSLAEAKTKIKTLKVKIEYYRDMITLYASGLK